MNYRKKARTGYNKYYKNPPRREPYKPTIAKIYGATAVISLAGAGAARHLYSPNMTSQSTKLARQIDPFAINKFANTVRANTDPFGGAGGLADFDFDKLSGGLEKTKAKLARKSEIRNKAALKTFIKNPFRSTKGLLTDHILNERTRVSLNSFLKNLDPDQALGDPKHMVNVAQERVYRGIGASPDDATLKSLIKYRRSFKRFVPGLVVGTASAGVGAYQIKRRKQFKEAYAAQQKKNK